MKRFLLVLLAICAIPAFAQRVAPSSFASDFQTVPVMGNTPGAGASFKTYVAILNPTSVAFPIDITLHNPAGTKRTETITLAPGELKFYANFLNVMFNGYVGGGAVTFKSADPSHRFIVEAEVHTDGQRYGTSIPTLEFAGTDSPSIAAGISVTGQFRTNVGCFNQSANPNTIQGTVYSRFGTAGGTVNLELPGNAWGQTAVNSLVVDGYIVFEPQEAAVCYAVVVSNSTNDGKFVLAKEYRP